MGGWVRRRGDQRPAISDAGAGPRTAARTWIEAESRTPTAGIAPALQAPVPGWATDVSTRDGTGYIDTHRHAIVITAAYNAVGSSLHPPKRPMSNPAVALGSSRRLQRRGLQPIKRESRQAPASRASRLVPAGGERTEQGIRRASGAPGETCVSECRECGARASIRPPTAQSDAFHFGASGGSHAISRSAPPGPQRITHMCGENGAHGLPFVTTALSPC